MRKWIIAIVVLCIIVGWGVLSLTCNNDPNDQIQTDASNVAGYDFFTAEELRQIFNENEADFDYVAEILSKVEEYFYVYIENGKLIYGPNQKPEVLKDKKLEACLKNLLGKQNLGSLDYSYPTSYYYSVNGVQPTIYFGNQVIRYNSPVSGNPNEAGKLKENWYYCVHYPN